MLLEVLLGRGDELDGSELVAASLEAGDDGTNEATLDTLLVLVAVVVVAVMPYLDAVRLDSDETGGLLASPLDLELGEETKEQWEHRVGSSGANEGNWGDSEIHTSAR